MIGRHHTLTSQNTRSDTWPHVKWAVSLVITDGHFNLPKRFVWVRMGGYTHYITSPLRVHAHVLSKT